ncbi:high mobility group protein B1-like [Ochotona princeps]|uniref:high mobility group protein B1-like n=1 Tax=Ochotona princeps TaxID=9978 RepID=UPI0027150212|nr:high mobility group protein B1-like [Ochotona princeps]
MDFCDGMVPYRVKLLLPVVLVSLITTDSTPGYSLQFQLHDNVFAAIPVIIAGIKALSYDSWCLACWVFGELTNKEEITNHRKGDPKKPRDKMSSCAFFVLTCWEEHKKQHPAASANFSESSKKCSERWKTMSAREKGKLEDMTKADKVHNEREMKTYIPLKGETKKKFKDLNASKRPPSAFFLFCFEYRPKIKGEHPGLFIGDVAKKLGVMWNNAVADDKRPDEKKATKLKEKYEKDIVAYCEIIVTL